MPNKVTDAEYLRLVKEAFFHRAQAFQPEMLFWNWGFDGTRGEYGDIGLTPDSHISLALELKAMADRLCQGKLVTVLCGGRRRDLASRLCLSIIKVMAGGDD